MKTARILLAVFSLAALAACGNDSITGSMAPGGARYDTAPAPGNDGTTDDSGDDTITSGETPPPTCPGTVVVTTDPSGNVTTACVAGDGKGGVLGSGG